MTRVIKVTVKEYARIEGVAERTVWRWIEKGAVRVHRNPGGGVRVFTISEDGSPQTNQDIQGHPYR